MSSALVLFEGEPRGGLLHVYVQPRFGDPVTITVLSDPADLVRVVVERIVDQLALSGLSRPDEVDRVQSMMVLRGAEDADVQSDDEGVLAATWLTEQDIVADNSTLGGASGAGSTDAAAAYDPDARVLGHLSRYLSALADQAETDVRTTSAVAKVQALHMELMRAMQAGDDRITLPNPGDQTPLAVGERDARAIAASLGQHTPAMVQVQADLASARAKQVGAIEAKEREAKSGGGGTGTQPGGGKTVPRTGSPPVGTGAPPGGGEPASGGAPGGEGPAETLVRPAGSGDEYARHIPIEDLTFIRGRGLQMVIGRIGSRWYVAKGRRESEFVEPDGTTVVRSEWYFGDFRDGAPPEEQPVEINYDKLMAFLHAKEEPQTETTSTAARLVSIALDFLPIVGDAKGLIEVAIGRDLITNEKLSTTERALGAVMLLLPFAGHLFRDASKVALRSTARTVRAEREITEQGIREVEEAAETFARARRAEEGEVVARRLSETAEETRRLPGSAARVGKCFAEGTLIAVDATASVPIERLAVGDFVLAMANSEEVPRAGEVVSARIASTRVHTAPSAVRLAIETVEAGGGGPQQEIVICTAAPDCDWARLDSRGSA